MYHTLWYSVGPRGKRYAEGGREPRQSGVALASYTRTAASRPPHSAAPRTAPGQQLGRQRAALPARRTASAASPPPPPRSLSAPAPAQGPRPKCSRAGSTTAPPPPLLPQRPVQPCDRPYYAGRHLASTRHHRARPHMLCARAWPAPRQALGSLATTSPDGRAVTAAAGPQPAAAALPGSGSGAPWHADGRSQ